MQRFSQRVRVPSPYKPSRALPAFIVIPKKWCQRPTKPPTSHPPRLLACSPLPSLPKFTPLTLSIFILSDWWQIVMETSANSGKPNRPPTALTPWLGCCAHKRLVKRQSECEREREPSSSALSPPLYSSVCPWPFRGMAVAQDYTAHFWLRFQLRAREFFLYMFKYQNKVTRGEGHNISSPCTAEIKANYGTNY